MNGRTFMDGNRIIYSLNVEDVQNVASEELGRSLSDKELRIVEDRIGDHIDWFEAIALAISAYIEQDASAHM